MQILFLQSELMHAYIRAQNFTEVPTTYVNKTTIIHSFKEMNVTFRYTKDYVGLGTSCTHVAYRDVPHDQVDQLVLGALLIQGLLPIDLTDTTLTSYENV